MSRPGANSRPLNRDLVLVRARTAGAPLLTFSFCDFKQQGELHDQTISSLASGFLVAVVIATGLTLVLAGPALAQGNSPWENAVNVLETAFTSTIARGVVARGNRGIRPDFRLCSIQKNIGDSLNVVVHVERRPGRRFLSEVLEINGYDPDVDRFDYTLVYARSEVPS